MTVIPTQEFYRNYDKQQMVVSPWEGHPNAKAHEIFADFFVTHLHKGEISKNIELHNRKRWKNKIGQTKHVTQAWQSCLLLLILIYYANIFILFP